MELEGKRVIALGERDSVPGEAIAAVGRSAGGEVIETRTECFGLTASGALERDTQALIKRIVEERGAEGIVVILGAADAEAVEVAAETARHDGPAWGGPVAGGEV